LFFTRQVSLWQRRFKLLSGPSAVPLGLAGGTMLVVNDSRKPEPRVIYPDPKPWKFAERERFLHASAQRVPTWRVENQARRHLAGMIKAVSDELEAPPTPTPIDKASADLARKVAAVNLGAIIVRSTSAIMTLVGSGHEGEALAHARISLEALIRGRQMADDKSGGVARKLLAGRRRGIKSGVLRPAVSDRHCYVTVTGELSIADSLWHRNDAAGLAVAHDPVSLSGADLHRDAADRSTVGFVVLDFAYFPFVFVLTLCSFFSFHLPPFGDFPTLGGRAPPSTDRHLEVPGVHEGRTGPANRRHRVADGLARVSARPPDQQCFLAALFPRSVAF
jgi:hypothetical protein